MHSEGNGDVVQAVRMEAEIPQAAQQAALGFPVADEPAMHGHGLSSDLDRGDGVEAAGMAQRIVGLAMRFQARQDERRSPILDAVQQHHGAAMGNEIGDLMPIQGPAL